MAEIETDIVIVGAGPAGSVAALRARENGATVALIDKSDFPRKRACAGWLGPAGVELSRSLGLEAKKIGAAPFAGLRIHSWDLKKSAAVDDKDLSGWIAPRDAFDNALLQAAQKAGAETILGAAVERVELGEKQVGLKLNGGGSVIGKAVLIADGISSPTARLLNLATAARVGDLPQCVYGERVAKGPAGAALDVAIGASRVGQIAVVARANGVVRIALSTRDTSATPMAQFERFCSAAEASGLLPKGANDEVWSGLAPGGAALDMDSHVGKRCLLLGDAGGFVAAFSHEGIYPAMKSGTLAADVACKAIKAPLFQDELASFEFVWRQELADYLRMPNTDLGLLMPLVFNNEQMSRRVARAFLLGQQF